MTVQHDSTRSTVAPSTAETIPGLQDAAEIIVDRWGVPHIYAQSLDDLFLAQGFNAARDRLWQLDLWRRRGLGQLSEVFGERFVERDRACRLFLYRGDMYTEWLTYASDTKRIVTAFVAGINAYIDLVESDPDRLPLEFRELGYRPARWEPEDVVRIRSHGLLRNVKQEVARAQVLREFGRDAEALRRELEPPIELTVPDGLDLTKIPDDVLRVYQLATNPVDFSPPAPTEPETDRLARLIQQIRDLDSLGSNNWTVAPSRTATGQAILANDPHRLQSVPSLRYIAHLESPELSVIGGGEPALPGISIGHNDRIAFGLTSFLIDLEDLYVYETNPDNPNEYRYRDHWEPMEIESTTITVKDQPPQTVTLKFTRHGPVIYEDPANQTAFAVRASWLEPGMAPYLASIAYLRARDWDEFREALNRWGAPGENQIYADIDGNIGWKPCGRTPIRPNWDGLLPVPGDGRYEWAGFWDHDQLPVEYNPPRGWIGTANQYILPADYPARERKLSFEWSRPYRYQRIAEVLEQNDRVTMPDMLALQTDTLTILAREVIAHLDGVTTADPTVQQGIDLLREWDYVESVDSAAAALWEIWWRRRLRPAIVAKVLPNPSAAQAIGIGAASVILDLIAHPDQRLGPDPTQTLHNLMRRTLAAAIEDAQRLLGPDMATWHWGDLHTAAMDHPIAPLVGEQTKSRLNIGPAPRGGGNDTVGNTGYPLGNFGQTVGASFRLIIDLGDWDNSLAMNTPGQSGDPTSPHYDDLFAPWAADEAFPLLYTREAIEAAAETRILLLPIEGRSDDENER